MTAPREDSVTSVHPLAAASIVTAVAGLISALPFLPEWLRGFFLLAFVFVGPGAAVAVWAGSLPQSIRVIIVIATGPVAVVLYSALASQYGGWSPFWSLVVLAVATLLAGAAHAATTLRDGNRAGVAS